MNRKKVSKTILLAAALICILGTTVFATVQHLTAKQAANVLGDSQLAKHFNEEEKELYNAVTDGNYTARLLGITSGANLSQFQSTDWDTYPERTYAVVSIAKTNGEAVTYEDSILVSPLIEGFAPWQYNIFTMHGGYLEQIVDGILYRIIEVDSLEYFADKHVYLAVVDSPFLSNEPFCFDEETGSISENKSYDGTNILFELNLDKSKANPAKAAEYLEKIKQEMDGGGEDSADFSKSEFKSEPTQEITLMPQS